MRGCSKCALLGSPSRCDTCCFEPITGHGYYFTQKSEPKEEKYLDWNEFIQALVEGKKLEYHSEPISKWIPFIHNKSSSLAYLHHIYSGFKYRIKPTKVKKKLHGNKKSDTIESRRTNKGNIRFTLIATKAPPLKSNACQKLAMKF